MPAPTALLKAQPPPPAADVPLPPADQDEEQLLDAPPTAIEPTTANPDTEMVLDEEARPRFPAAKNVDGVARRETRKIRIPPHRMSPYVTQRNRPS